MYENEIMQKLINKAASHGFYWGVFTGICSVLVPLSIFIAWLNY